MPLPLKPRTIEGGDRNRDSFVGDRVLTASYSDGRLSFLYPENWILSEADGDESPDELNRQVSLESPGGGLWWMQSSLASERSEDRVAEVKAALDEQYENIEWNDVQASFHGFACSGCDGFFYSLDLMICARIRAFTTLDRSILILVQSESRELERLGPVYDAISLSLLQSCAGAARGELKK